VFQALCRGWVRVRSCVSELAPRWDAKLTIGPATSLGKDAASVTFASTNVLRVEDAGILFIEHNRVKMPGFIRTVDSTTTAATKELAFAFLPAFSLWPASNRVDIAERWTVVTA
jgi:hypothetical protein